MFKFSRISVRIIKASKHSSESLLRSIPVPQVGLGPEDGVRVQKVRIVEC